MNGCLHMFICTVFCVFMWICLRNWKLHYLDVNAVCVLGVICTSADIPSEATLVKHSFDPLSTTKENWGYERRREEDNMNIIFWILEEDIPYRALHEYFMKLAFPHLLSMFYNVDFWKYHDGVTLTEIYSNRQVLWSAKGGILLHDY